MSGVTVSTSSNYNDLVQELYVAYFGRPADYAGLGNFAQALSAANAPTDAAGLLAAYQTNTAVKTLVDAFGTSTESANLYGSGSTESFVNAIFTDLFNRQAAVSGLTFWSDAINSSQISKGQAALAILSGAEQNTTTQGLTDQQTIANKVTVAENFTTVLSESSSTIIAYEGQTAANIGRLMLASVDANTDAAHFDVQTTINSLISGPPFGMFTLTGSPESVVGIDGNNVFNAVLDNAAGIIAGGQLQTLVSGDSITAGVASGGYGTYYDDLNLTDFGIGDVMRIPDGVTFVGITQLNIQSLEAVAEDFSGWHGLTNISVRTSTGDDTIVAPTQAIVSVTDTAGNVSIQGGADVTVKTDNAHAVTLTSTVASFTATVGDSSNAVTDITIDASVKITAGAGANTVTLGPGASGTVSFAAHTAADAVVLAPSEANPKAIVVISVLNNDGQDTIRFSGDVNTLVGFAQVTAGAVAAGGGDATTLAAWVQAADGAQGSGVGGAAHTVTWFVFEGNTYLLESVAGQASDGGTMRADNTLVELAGTGYTFAHTTGAGGTVHLLG